MDLVNKNMFIVDLEHDLLEEKPTPKEGEFDMECHSDTEYEETHILVMENVDEIYNEFDSTHDDENCDNIENYVHDIDDYLTENVNNKDSETKFIEVSAEKNLTQDIFEISSDSDTCLGNEIEINGMYRTTIKRNTSPTRKQTGFTSTCSPTYPKYEDGAKSITYLDKNDCTYVSDAKLKIHDEPTESVTRENATKTPTFDKQPIDLTVNRSDSDNNVDLENGYCIFCNVPFKNCKSPSIHTSINLFKGTFRCDVCGNHFASNAGLSRHKIKHIPATMKCSFCTKVFKTNYWLKSHEKRHIMPFQHGTSKENCKDSLETSDSQVDFT